MQNVVQDIGYGIRMLRNAGIGLGLAGAVVVTRLLSSELYDVCALAVLMGLVTMLACYVPERRGMAVDPLFALGYD